MKKQKKKDNEISAEVSSSGESSANKESNFDFASTKSSTKKIEFGQDEQDFLAELFRLVEEKSSRSHISHIPTFIETEFQNKFGKHVNYKTLNRKYLCQSNTAKSNKKSTPKRTSSIKRNLTTTFNVPSPESKKGKIGTPKAKTEQKAGLRRSGRQTDLKQKASLNASEAILVENVDSSNEEFENSLNVAIVELSETSSLSPEKKTKIKPRRKLFSTLKTLSPKGKKGIFSQFSRSINTVMSSFKKKSKVQKDFLDIGFVESDDDSNKKYLDLSSTVENKM